MGLRHAEYHALPALGGSTAAKFGTRSLAEALVPFGGSDAATIGSCVDAIWCEGLMPSDVYEVQARRSAKSTAELAARGIAAISASMEDTITACLAALRDHRMASRILEASTAQEQFTWAEALQDGTEIECKGMADLVADGVVWDLKTIGGRGDGCPVDPRKFQWVARDRGIDIQLAHYLRGMRKNGHEVDRAGVIGVSTKAPHLVGVFGMSQNVLDAAEHRLIEHVYPLWARLQSGDAPYMGFGALRPDGLEPIHEIDFDRRD